MSLAVLEVEDESTSVRTKSRDLRSNLYSRIGVAKKAENGELPSNSIEILAQ